MRLLFVADGRSPIALNWMRYFVEAGDEVHLASTFQCKPELALASLHLTPAALSGLKVASGAGGKAPARGGVWGGAALRLRTAVRQWLGPLTLRRAGQRLRAVIAHLHPDLVHAMRIPFEGMLAAEAGPGAPLLVSVWGNDFTLHATASPLMRRRTLQTLQRADALHADCQRDMRLAAAWGFPASRPQIVLPGAGGVQAELFHPPTGEERSAVVPLVIQPRGFRAYVDNRAFFYAARLIAARLPAVRFVCPAMAGHTQAVRWVKELGLEAHVELLPSQSREQMASLFRRAQAAVSPSTHDGTPNTLLEAMACGCFPIAGDLDSLREWITSGVNGLLVDPRDPQQIADAVLLALRSPELRQRAAEKNTALIAARADYRAVMPRARQFYLDLLL